MSNYNQYCYCHTCDKRYHYMGISSHRAMHARRFEDCKITFSGGNTETWLFSRDAPLTRIEVNYYWGDDTFCGVYRSPVTAQPRNVGAWVRSMVDHHKPRHTSPAFALVYLNGVYRETLEVY